MNLLEHYVTNITHEEPIEKNGMLFFKVVCDVDCYGNKEIQKEVLLSEDDYAEAKKSRQGARECLTHLDTQENMA